MTIAALFVETNGVYFGLPDVDPWDKQRNAMLYAGPYPVVAHPPCSRWCRLAGLVEARWGHKRGDDGGAFASALANVRRLGGVLEHPAYSDAWPAFGLTAPRAGAGWTRASCGGWVVHFDQGHYGHAARKATWLYTYGTPRGGLPELIRARCNTARALTSWCCNHTDSSKPRLSSREASRTPLIVRDLLLSIARASVV